MIGISLLFCLFFGLSDFVNGQTSNDTDLEYICGHEELSSSNDIKVIVILDYPSSGTALIGLHGPVDQWFGIGFGATDMDGTYTLIVDADGYVTERNLGDHTAGSVLNSTITIYISNTTDGSRIVFLARAMDGADSDYYTFDSSDTSIDAIWATSSDDTITYHGSLRGSGSISIDTVDDIDDCEDSGSIGLNAYVNGKAFGLCIVAIIFMLQSMF